MGEDRLPADSRLALASYDAGDAATQQAFKFEPRRARLDWRLLSGIDVDRIARETDIDTLEQALDTVAFGDVTVEDPRLLTGEGRSRAHSGPPVLDAFIFCLGLRACRAVLSPMRFSLKSSPCFHTLRAELPEGIPPWTADGRVSSACPGSSARPRV